MNEIRVLALDDDNHGMYFYDRHGLRYSTMRFIAQVAHRHDVNYKIRYIYLCDIPEDMDNDFEAVDGCRNNIPYGEAFERLWAIGEEI